MRDKLTIKLIVITIIAIVFLPNAIFAQNRTISGTISDQTGTLLSGATIAVKGNSKISTTSELNGTFRLSVPANAKVIVISYVGRNPKEVSIDGTSVVAATLDVADNSLNEVVVIGYGSVKRSNVTSSISSVSEKDIKNLPVAGIDQAIQGKVAGVTVTNNGGQPGGGVSVRIRGITTVSGTNEPLYVIDGVPFSAQNNTLSQQYLGGGAGSTAQSVLSTLNPNDIASIDILKDASAQAIYGSRGANGVVIINTKRGRAGEGRIAYDTYFGWQEIPKKLPIMNLRENAIYQNSLLAEINAVTGGNQDTIPEFRHPEVLGKGTDWQDEIYQKGTIQSHQLSFSGGQGKTNYYFSGGYFDQLGTLIETKFRRYTLRFNLDQQVKSWFKAGISANLSRSNQKVGLSDGFDAVTSVVLYNSPAAPVVDNSGKYYSTIVLGGAQFGSQSNPVALAKLRDVNAINTRILGAVYGEIDFGHGFTLRNEFNYDFGLRNSNAYQPLVLAVNGTNIMSPSKIRDEKNNSMYWAVKSYLNYNKSFGVHSVYATAGHEVQASRYEYLQGSRVNLTLNLPSLAAGQAPDANGANGEELGAGSGEWSMESYFGRVNYTYNNKYAISGSLRYDASSAFGPGNRWGLFKAVSASWTATNEDFLQNIKFLNYLKLRVGYGEVGNQDIGGNQFTSNIQLFGSGPFGAGGLPANVANPDLAWMTVKTYNAGIDATILNRKIDIAIDVYKKVSTDMLLVAQLPSIAGLGTGYPTIQPPTANDGQVTNKGIDISLTSYNIQRKDFSWKTNVIFSHYKSNLDKLNTPDATINGDFDEYGSRSLVTLSRQGQPLGTFFGFVTDGLFSTQAELNNGINYGLTVKPDGLWLGDIRYKDLNGDKVVDSKDVTVIGDPNPDFTYGVTNTFNYKGIDLSIFVYGSQGADIFNYARRQTEGLNNSGANQIKDVMNRWTPSNTGAEIPRYNQWHNNNFRISDRFIEDGSFLRIQTISLGYNLPKNIISKAKLNSAKIYVSLQNVYTFTNYSGYDPELGAINNQFWKMNIDNGHYPNPRTFTVGANLEF
ncbi:MAG: TonB-dependent receptor [Chitinophagaceae bacterium]